MLRTTNSPTTKNRRRKIIKAAKGYSMRRHRTLKCAMEAVRHAKVDKTVSRNLLKRDNKKLWIIRLNAFAKENNMKYSGLIKHIQDISGIKILTDKKILVKILFFAPEVAKKLLEQSYYK